MNTESELDHKFQSPNRFRLSFDLSSIPSGEKLQAAELSLSRIPILNEDSNRKLSRILVYDILRPGMKGHSTALLRLIDSKPIDIKKNDTVSLDVHPAVERWIKDPKNNHGLLVHVRGMKQEHVRLKRSADERNDTWVVSRPMLFTYTDDGRYKIVLSLYSFKKRVTEEFHFHFSRVQNNTFQQCIILIPGTRCLLQAK